MRSKLSRLTSGAMGALFVAATMVLSAGPGSAADAVRWRVQSHWPSASSSYKDSLEFLKSRIEERTGGRLVLQLHEDGALFPAKEIFNAVSRGVIEMGTISPAYIRDKVTLAGIASGLPFAFHEVWEAAYFHRTLGFEQMLRDEVAKFGVYYSTDKVYPTEMVVKKPIKSYDDFKGLKIRSSGTLQVFLTSAGAAASYLSGSELYTSLATGVMDGAHWGAVQGADSMGLYEVAKYHVLPPLNIAGTDAFIVNQKALDKLPEDVRKIVLAALDEQFWLRTNEYEFKEKVTLAKVVKEKKVVVNTLPEDVQAKLAEFAVKDWEKEGGKSELTKKALDMLKTMLRELGYI